MQAASPLTLSSYSHCNTPNTQLFPDGGRRFLATHVQPDTLTIGHALALLVLVLPLLIGVAPCSSGFITKALSSMSKRLLGSVERLKEKIQ